MGVNSLRSLEYRLSEALDRVYKLEEELASERERTEKIREFAKKIIREIG